MRRAAGIGAVTIALVVGQFAAAQATTEKHVKDGTYGGRSGPMTTDNAIFFRVHGKGTHKTIRNLQFGNLCLTNSEPNPPHIKITTAGKFHHSWTATADPSNGVDAYHASLTGRFPTRTVAKGTLKIKDDGCSSTYNFKAKHPCSTTKVKYKCPYGVKP